MQLTHALIQQKTEDDHRIILYFLLNSSLIYEGILVRQKE